MPLKHICLVTSLGGLGCRCYLNLKKKCRIWKIFPWWISTVAKNQFTSSDTVVAVFLFSSTIPSTMSPCFQEKWRSKWKYFLCVVLSLFLCWKIYVNFLTLYNKRQDTRDCSWSCSLRLPWDLLYERTQSNGQSRMRILPVRVANHTPDKTNYDICQLINSLLFLNSRHKMKTRSFICAPWPRIYCFGCNSVEKHSWILWL